MAYSPKGEQGLSRSKVRATSPINERVGGFLRFLFGPALYNQGVVDARIKAMERGSKIPFLPEFGLSEGFQSYVDQAGRDLKTAFGSPEKEKETETEKETDLPPPPGAEPQASDLSGKEFLNQQYNRYFGSPEFDNVFGSGARGEGAPKDAAAMEILGNQLSAPEKDTNISSMYAAQSAMGRVNEDKIQQMYADRPDLQEWAKKNPMLAQREYLKAERRRANDMPLGLDNETPYGNLGTRAQYDNPMGKEAYARMKEDLMNKAAQK